MATPKATLRLAKPEDAEALTALAIAAKSHWGYSDAFMAAAHAELAISPADIASRPFIVAELLEQETQPVAVYCVGGSPPKGELSLLWVRPGMMGLGLGRMLWQDMLTRSAERGFTEISVHADPNAEGFYVRMGAEKIGERESDSIPGRMLPLMRIVIPGVEMER